MSVQSFLAFAAALLGLMTAPVYADQPGCMKKVREYCQRIFSPPNSGNVVLKTGKTSSGIQLGWEKTGHPSFRAQLYRLKLESLPRQRVRLRKILAQLGYEPVLRKVLHGNAFEKLTPDEYLEFSRNLSIEDTLLDLAFNLLAREEVIQSISGLTHVPLTQWSDPEMFHFDAEYAVTKAAFFHAVWNGTPEWKRFVATFESVRSAMIDILKHSPRVSPKMRDSLVQIVQETKLLPAWSAPREISMKCGAIGNAHYNSSTRSIVVCPQIILGQEAEATLAHELAHAIGPAALTSAIVRMNPAIRQLAAWGEAQCLGKPVECGPWKEFKKNFDDRLGDMPAMTPWSPEVFRCLSRRDANFPRLTEIESVAGSMAEGIVSGLSGSVPQSLVFQEIPDMAGVKRANPAYLNVCLVKGRYFHDLLPNPDYGDYTAALLLSTELACRDDRATPAGIKNALETTTQLTKTFLTYRWLVEGKYGTSDSLVRRDWAEDLDEQQADAIATEVMASRLRRIENPEGRWNSFMSNMASFCETPGPRTVNDEVTRSVDAFNFDDSHTLGVARMEALLQKPVRDLLGCKADFKNKDCPILDPK